MDWIRPEERAYTCTITERERRLKAESQARISGAAYRKSAAPTQPRPAQSQPYDPYASKGVMDWIPANERVGGIADDIGEGSGGRPQGIQNKHCGLDWIPDSERPPRGGYASLKNPPPQRNQQEQHYGQRKEGAFDWIPANERSHGGDDSIVSGSLGGGWNSQFIKKRGSAAPMPSAHRSQGTPHSRSPGERVVNKYNQEPGTGDVWSGTSVHKGPAPLWDGSNSGGGVRAPTTHQPESGSSERTTQGTIVNKYNLEPAQGDVWSGSSKHKGPAPLW